MSAPLMSVEDLEVVDLAEADLVAFRDGNRFETEVPSTGDRLFFKLLVGADERSMDAYIDHRFSIGPSILDIEIIIIDHRFLIGPSILRIEVLVIDHRFSFGRTILGLKREGVTERPLLYQLSGLLSLSKIPDMWGMIRA